MPDRYDVVVVGAGPAGSLAARAAAEMGARTLLVDQRPEIGHPVQCGEFLPAASELADLFPSSQTIGSAYSIPSESILRTTRTLACVAPTRRRYVFPLLGYTVSRRSFDKSLAFAAEGAGAELRFPCGVTRVVDERVELARGDSVSAEVIVGADGPLSTVARGTGYHVEREMFRMITAGVPGTFADEIELHFGRVAPGGYAWVFPRVEDANVGLGVTHVPRGRTLSGLLDTFLGARGLPRPTERTRWWVPIGPPPSTAVAGRALFVGDAANLVMATNGGGIPTAMLSGWAAGRIAAQHVREGTPLSEYDRWLTRELREPLARAERVKSWGDRVVGHDLLLALGMRYIGASGLDAMMRLRWPRRLGHRA
ncbi:MAG: geranylgeranyl reductase family protein [Thermoplasmata archaeon]